MSFPTIFLITEEELDLNKLLAEITTPSTGAAALFTGMVRGLTSREPVHETAYLDYEAYVPMAEAKMRQVADEIFERFTQEVQGGRRDDGVGLGLGLAIVHHLVELHGGTVQGQSPGPGLGSTFTVVLPRHIRAGPSAA